MGRPSIAFDRQLLTNDAFKTAGVLLHLADIVKQQTMYQTHVMLLVS